VASPDIKPEMYAAINRAIEKAVRLINRDKKKYLRYFIADIPRGMGALKPEDFHLARLRYVNPAPYPREEFQRAYEWMLSWNLIKPDASFKALVDNRITVV
jgi:NitT/TauT family transport system substrate-binding protein